MRRHSINVRDAYRIGVLQLYPQYVQISSNNQCIGGILVKILMVGNIVTKALASGDSP